MSSTSPSSWREGAQPPLGDRDVPFDAAAARTTREASLRAWAALPADAQAEAGTGTERETPDDETEIAAPSPAAAPPSPPPADPILGARFLAMKGAKKTFFPVPLAKAATRRAAKMDTRAERDRALLAAASLGDVPTIRAIVAAGADVECRDENGFTPLIFASWRGRALAVRALLHAGADDAAAAAGGATSAAVAAANGHSAVLRELREARAAAPPAATPSGGADSGRRGMRRTTAASAGAWVGRAVRVTRLAAPAEVIAQVPSGVGALCVDGVAPEFLSRVDSLMDTVTGAKGTRGACTDAERLFFTDAQGWVRAGLAGVLAAAAAAEAAGAGAGPGAAAAGAGAGGAGAAAAAGAAGAGSLGFSAARVLPHMRFLRYSQPGGRLTSHVDLRKVDEETGRRSTHTFCLYLATCERGGETVIMDQVGEPTDPMSDRVGVLSECAPVRGRLFIFPHDCPHAGRPVVDVPKLLLRGELYLV